MNTHDLKRALRHEIHKRKEAFMASTTSTERCILSLAILKKVAATEAFENAKTVLAYYSLDDELDTHAFLSLLTQEKGSISLQSNIALQQKQILLPKVNGDNLTLHPFHSEADLLPGSYSIMEPKTPAITDYSEVDLVIVPGMAFDSTGNRLGRGRGYYDKLFSRALRPDVIKIGVCYPFQMVEEVPCDAFDIRMDAVFSHD